MAVFTVGSLLTQKSWVSPFSSSSTLPSSFSFPFPRLLLPPPLPLLLLIFLIETSIFETGSYYASNWP